MSPSTQCARFSRIARKHEFIVELRPGGEILLESGEMARLGIVRSEERLTRRERCEPMREGAGVGESEGEPPGVGIEGPQDYGPQE